MSDARWAKVTNCGECDRALGCPDAAYEPPYRSTSCPLSRAGEIPEVKKLRKAARDIILRGVITERLELDFTDLTAALAAFDKGDKEEEK